MAYVHTMLLLRRLPFKTTTIAIYPLVLLYPTLYPHYPPITSGKPSWKGLGRVAVHIL